MPKRPLRPMNLVVKLQACHKKKKLQVETLSLMTCSHSRSCQGSSGNETLYDGEMCFFLLPRHHFSLSKGRVDMAAQQGCTISVSQQPPCASFYSTWQEWNTTWLFPLWGTFNLVTSLKMRVNIAQRSWIHTLIFPFSAVSQKPFSMMRLCCWDFRPF